MNENVREEKSGDTFKDYLMAIVIALIATVLVSNLVCKFSEMFATEAVLEILSKFK